MLTLINKKCFLLFLCLAVPIIAVAQTGVITGRLTDSINNQDLGNASVLLLNAIDSSLLARTVAGENGTFYLKDLPFGTFLLEASFQGYQQYSKQIRITKEDPLFDCGTIYMQVFIRQLDSITVTSPPIRLKKDTVEYNAGSFKTRDNESVEALLKLLPGIQVLPDGSIKANGQTIQQILVDGQPFFENTRDAATKMLPAEIISKVQVYNAGSDTRNFTGIEDGQKTKTLNLTIKRNRKKGAFGQAFAGAGTDETFGAGINLNNFDNDRQLSVLGQGANVSNANFTSMTKEVAAPDNGITTNWGGGLNYRDKWGAHTNFNGSYTYAGQHVLNGQQSYIQNIFPHDSLTYNSQANTGTTDGKSHALRFNIEQLVNPDTRLTIRPYINIADNEDLSQQHSLLTGNQNAHNDTIYAADAYTKGKSNMGIAATKLMFAHKSSKTGRALSATVDLLYNKKNADNYSYALNRYMIPYTITDTLNQRRALQSERVQLKTDITYAEPLGKKQSAILNYGYKYEINRNTIDVTRYDQKSHQYMITDSAQSNDFRNRIQDNYVRLGYQSDQEKYTLSIGLGVQIENFINNNLSTYQDFRRDFISFIPKVNFNYLLSDAASIQFNYDRLPRSPGIEQLQPTTSTIDSLRILKGNPDLKQIQTQSLSLTYQHTDPVRQRMYAIVTGLNITSDDIQYSTTQLPNGVQVAMPINVNGSFGFNGNFNYSFPLKVQGATMNLSSGINYLQNRTLLNNDEVMAKNTELNEMIGINMELFKSLSMNLTANAIWHTAMYSSVAGERASYFIGQLSGNINYVLNKWSFASDINISFNGNTQPGVPRWVPVISPALIRKLLKNNTGELKLNVLDLLNQNTSIFRNVNNNTIQTISNNVRRRYVMLSFTYNFRHFKK